MRRLVIFFHDFQVCQWHFNDFGMILFAISRKIVEENISCWTSIATSFYSFAILILCECFIADYGSVISSRKGAAQSSTGWGGVPSRAVDGNKNSQWNGKSCTHTNRQRNAWWRVDLGGNYLVTKVQVTNRGDCCGNRLSNFDIRVGNTDRNPKANQV